MFNFLKGFSLKMQKRSDIRCCKGREQDWSIFLLDHVGIHRGIRISDSEWFQSRPALAPEAWLQVQPFELSVALPQDKSKANQNKWRLTRNKSMSIPFNKQPLAKRVLKDAVWNHSGLSMVSFNFLFLGCQFNTFWVYLMFNFFKGFSLKMQKCSHFHSTVIWRSKNNIYIYIYYRYI